MNLLVNPAESEAIEFLDSVPISVKTICDDFGNLYLWDGECYEHRDVMTIYSISDVLYETAERIYKDFGGAEAIIDVIRKWKKSIKGKRYLDGVWID